MYAIYTDVQMFRMLYLFCMRYIQMFRCTECYICFVYDIYRCSDVQNAIFVSYAIYIQMFRILYFQHGAFDQRHQVLVFRNAFLTHFFTKNVIYLYANTTVILWTLGLFQLQESCELWTPYSALHTSYYHTQLIWMI